MDIELSEVLLEFSLLFVTISAISLLFKRFRLPIVLAPILFGIFVRYTPLAPYLEKETFQFTLNVLANFGVLLLLFYIGLKIDFAKLEEFGKPILKITLYSILLPFFFGFLLIWGLGYGAMLALIIGMTRIPVAEAVVIPILEEFNLLNTKVGQFIIGPGILDDVIEVFLVAFVSIWLANKFGHSQATSLSLIFSKIFIFIIVAYVGYKWLVPFLGKRVDHSPRIAMVFCLAILLLYAGLAEYVQLGLVIGSLLAGIIITPWLNTLEENLKTTLVDGVQLCAYGFVGIFFFYQIGLLVEPQGVLGHPLLVLGLFLAGTLGKLFSGLLMVHDGSLTLKEGIAVGVGLDVRMTTELIIAKMLLSANAIDTTLYTALIAASSISMVTVPILISIILQRWGNELCTTINRN